MEIKLARENNAEYQEVHKKLQNKQRDYALPQSDSHRNHGTKYGSNFNQMANSIAHSVRKQIFLNLKTNSGF